MEYLARKITNSVTLIYGFKFGGARFSLIATTHRIWRVTKIYGLLSRNTMEISDFIALWYFLQKTIKTKYVEFEALPADSKVYQRFLPIVKIDKTFTFNGHEAERLLVLTKSKVKGAVI